MTEEKEYPDSLLAKILDSAQDHEKEANYHKILHRSLWYASSAISVLIAVFTNIEFVIFGATSSTIASLLAIILPLVTGYIVLRSPEKLWIHEIKTRNELYDLHAKLNFLIQRNKKINCQNIADNYLKIDADVSEIKNEYFKIMKEASEHWASIKTS